MAIASSCCTAKDASFSRAFMAVCKKAPCSFCSLLDELLITSPSFAMLMYAVSMAVSMFKMILIASLLILTSRQVNTLCCEHLIFQEAPGSYHHQSNRTTQKGHRDNWCLIS